METKLLAAWSITTTWQEKYNHWNSKPYRDTPRSRWEAAKVKQITGKQKPRGD